MNTKLAFAALTLLTLSGCYSDRLDKSNNYWQRTKSDSALYLTGPKAQHQLHKDIASCVAQMQELDRLGSIRDAVPPNTANNQVPDYNPANSNSATYDAPNRDGPLYAEYYDFTDFEGCMREKGWERAVAIQPEYQRNAKDNWIRSLVDPNYGGGPTSGDKPVAPSVGTQPATNQ